MGLFNQLLLNVVGVEQGFAFGPDQSLSLFRTGVNDVPECDAVMFIRNKKDD